MVHPVWKEEQTYSIIPLPELGSKPSSSITHPCNQIQLQQERNRIPSPSPLSHKS